MLERLFKSNERLAKSLETVRQVKELATKDANGAAKAMQVGQRFFAQAEKAFVEYAQTGAGEHFTRGHELLYAGMESVANGELILSSLHTAPRMTQQRKNPFKTKAYQTDLDRAHRFQPLEAGQALVQAEEREITQLGDGVIGLLTDNLTGKTSTQSARKKTIHSAIGKLYLLARERGYLETLALKSDTHGYGSLILNR